MSSPRRAKLLIRAKRGTTTDRKRSGDLATAVRAERFCRVVVDGVGSARAGSRKVLEGEGAVRAGVLEVAAMYWEMPTPLAVRFRRESTSSPMVETRLTRSVVRLPWAHGVCKTHRPRHGPTTRGFERPDVSLRGTSPSPATWLALVVAEVPPLRVQASRREGRQKRRRACRSMLSMVALREIRPRRPTQAARWTCSSARRLATSMRGSSA